MTTFFSVGSTRERFPVPVDSLVRRAHTDKPVHSFARRTCIDKPKCFAGFVRPANARCGISLIETVACVAIVASMSTAIVSVMQNSARVASASRTSIGAPAKARQALRELSDRMQKWDEDSGIELISGSTIRTGTQTYRFIQRPSVTRRGRDLILRNDDGEETWCVLGDLVDFQISPIPDRRQPHGFEMRLILKKEDEEAAALRPHEREADIRTSVCFPPQL